MAIAVGKQFWTRFWGKVAAVEVERQLDARLVRVAV